MLKSSSGKPRSARNGIFEEVAGKGPAAVWSEAVRRATSFVPAKAELGIGGKVESVLTLECPYSGAFTEMGLPDVIMFDGIAYRRES